MVDHNAPVVFLLSPFQFFEQLFLALEVLLKLSLDLISLLVQFTPLTVIVCKHISDGIRTLVLLMASGRVKDAGLAEVDLAVGAEVK